VTVVRNTLLGPTGVPAVGVAVSAVLRGAVFTADRAAEVVGVAATTTDNAGHWQLDLTAASGLDQPGAWYDLREGAQLWTVVVPDAGPVNLGDVVTEVVAPQGPQLALTRAEADARYGARTLTASVVGGAVVVDLAASPWVITADGTPAYDPDGVTAGSRGVLQLDPASGLWTITTPAGEV
jgi:hypothetical protein